MDEIKVNPVLGTMRKCGNQCGIQEINDTCYGICGAFSGVSNSLMVDPDCAKQCAALVDDEREKMYGVRKCNHQAPERPVLWDRAPHYIPQLAKQHGGGLAGKLNELEKVCEDMCVKTSDNPVVVSKCKENCRTDAGAIVGVKKVRFEGYENDSRNDKDCDKGVCAPWIIGVIVVVLVIAGLLAIRNQK